MHVHVHVHVIHSFSLSLCHPPFPPLLPSFSPSPSLFQHLQQQFIPDGVIKVTKMLSLRPTDWPSCVQLARVKFEKYFNHKVLYTCTCMYEELLLQYSLSSCDPVNLPFTLSSPPPISCCPLTGSESHPCFPSGH